MKDNLIIIDGTLRDISILLDNTEDLIYAFSVLPERYNRFEFMDDYNYPAGIYISSWNIVWGRKNVQIPMDKFRRKRVILIKEKINYA